MQVITNKHLHTDTVAPWLGPGEADGAADSTRGPGTYTGSGGGDTAGQSPPPPPRSASWRNGEDGDLDYTDRKHDYHQLHQKHLHGPDITIFRDRSHIAH